MSSLARILIAQLGCCLPLLTSGCIVAPPAEFDEPEKTVPVLDLTQASPPVYTVVNLVAPMVEPLTISVPVRSEDAGDNLYGVLYQDYDFARGRALRIDEVPASTFEDASRSITVDWDYSGLSDGCYQLALLAVHRTDFDVETSRPRDSADVQYALATWWVNLQTPGAPAPLLTSCPGPGARTAP